MESLPPARLMDVTVRRRRWLRAAAAIGLVGAVASVVLLPWLFDDLGQGLWLALFGAFGGLLPFVIARLWFWRCPFCGTRLDLQLAAGRCTACDAQLEPPS